MAERDAITILSHNQVISDTTFSDRYIDAQTLADYGVGNPLYLKAKIKGTHTYDLRIQLLGFATTDFSTGETVLSDSGLIDTDELVAGKEISLPFHITDKKYRYITARYIPCNTSTGEPIPAGESETVNASNYAAPAKVGESETAVANGISAWISTTPRSNVMYGYANEDKVTAQFFFHNS